MLTLFISGMTCANCEKRIQTALQKSNGVVSATVSFQSGTAVIESDPDLITAQEIKDIIERLHYTVLPHHEESKRIRTTKRIRTVGLLALMAALFVLLSRFGVLNLLVPSRLAESGIGYGMLFVVGLLTSVHCVAMCGGINLSQSLPGGNSGRAFRPALLYNLGRVISYTAAGVVFGAIGWCLGGGSSLNMSSALQGALKLLAGAVMVVMGANMLFPALRRFALRLPSRNLGGKTPLVIGLLNGLMPCGPLQSMQIIALASANPLTGGLSMLLFSLGTVPLMLGLGSLVSALGRRFTRGVTTVGATLVVVLGFAMFAQGWNLAGLPVVGFGQPQNGEVSDVADVQIVRSVLHPGSYPNITVQAGTPVRWIWDAPDSSINGCNGRMMIGTYNVEHRFVPGENVIEFTPEHTGQFRYTCWMGMITGTITVK